VKAWWKSHSQGLRRKYQSRSAGQHVARRHPRGFAPGGGHKLDQAQLRLFHPIGFMLASPAQDAAEALSYFPRGAVEDKYDGIRAQVHVGGKGDPRVRIFSRTLDEISPAFPELPLALRAFLIR